MKRMYLFIVVDVLLAVLGLTLLLTGLLMAFVLPPHSGADSVWGLTRHEWGDVHFWIAVATVMIVVLHLALHWSWVCVQAAKLVGQAKPQPGSGARRMAAGASAVARRAAGGRPSLGGSQCQTGQPDHRRQWGTPRPGTGARPTVATGGNVTLRP